MYWKWRSPQFLPYNRERAVQYARQWALKRNPQYYDFETLGGDCTNFASQVIFAGSGVMNYDRVNGWYYINASNRSASWTGVNFLHNFLINNRGVGPFAAEVDVRDIMPGDIAQLSFKGNNDYGHSPVIIATGMIPSFENILVAAHTDDRLDYPITEYSWEQIRFLHIEGVRKYI